MAGGAIEVPPARPCRRRHRFTRLGLARGTQAGRPGVSGAAGISDSYWTARERRGLGASLPATPGAGSLRIQDRNLARRESIPDD